MHHSNDWPREHLSGTSRMSSDIKLPKARGVRHRIYYVFILTLPDTIYFIYHFHCHRDALSECRGAAGGVSDTRSRKSISLCIKSEFALKLLARILWMCVRLGEHLVSLLIFRSADAHAMMPCNVKNEEERDACIRFWHAHLMLNLFDFIIKIMTYFTQWMRLMQLQLILHALRGSVCLINSSSLNVFHVSYPKMFHGRATKLFPNFRAFYLLGKHFFRQRLLFSIEFSGSSVSLLLLKCIGIFRI